MVFEASASVVFRNGDFVRERSSRARFALVATGTRRGLVSADVTLDRLVASDERALVSLDGGIASLTIPGSPALNARTDDLLSMRRIDSLASTFGVDLSTRVSMQVPSGGGVEGSALPSSAASAAAFASLLAPELPASRVAQDSRWMAWHRPFPVDLEAVCRARFDVRDIVAGRAHVRWGCDEMRIAGLDARCHGVFVVDLARGIVVELDGRIDSAPARRRSGGPSLEATYSVHLDE